MSTYSIDSAKAVAKQVSELSSLDVKSAACLLSAEITGACGEKTLSEAKSLLEDEVLDSKLLSGTKLRWFPKEDLRFVSKHVAAVGRLLAKNGVSFGKGMTFLPLSVLPELAEQLEEARAEFMEDVELLKRNYHAIITRHQNNNPDIAKHIERCVETPEEFARRFTFQVHPPMAIQPLFDGDEAEITKTVSEQLLSDIASAANKIYQDSFSGKERATKKKMGPVLALRDKLINLSFLDASVSRVALKFDEVLSALPNSYPLEGGDYHTVCHFLTLVSDEAKVKNYGAGGDELDDNRNQVQDFDFDSDLVDDDVTAEDSTPEQELSATTSEVEQETDAVKSQSVVDEVIDELSGLTPAQPLAEVDSVTGDWDFNGW